MSAVRERLSDAVGFWGRPILMPHGRAYVADQGTVRHLPARKRIFATQHRDHRVLDVVQATITQDFEHHYLVLEDERARVRGIQPFFLHTQDVLAGAGPLLRGLVRRARVRWPRLLTMRMLMVGSPVGEGSLGAIPDDADWCARALRSALVPCARRCGASLVVLKEFPASLRPYLKRLIGAGYVRMPSMPYTVLDLDFSDFDEFMRTRLSHAYRKNLRRKFRASVQAPPIRMDVVSDLAPYVDEAYPLYLQVYERSILRFEKLTAEYLRRLGQAAPDTTRFFLWRQSGRLIAFSVCSLHEDALWDEYLGMDYRVALDLHLYFYTLRDLIGWGCRHGLRRYYSTALNYDPKLHLQFALAPMDLYVRHVHPIVNPVFRRILPVLAPTRHEATVQRFRNAKEL